MKSKLYILDSHPIVAEGLSSVIAGTNDLFIVDHADNAKTALAQIPSLKPDVVILDVAPRDASDGDQMATRYPYVHTRLIRNAIFRRTAHP